LNTTETKGGTSRMREREAGRVSERYIVDTWKEEDGASARFGHGERGMTAK